MKKQFSLVKISTVSAPLYNELYTCLYESDEEISSGLDLGSEIVGSFKENVLRNVKFHRKYFALIKIAYDNLPERFENRFRNIDEFRDEMKMQAGAREKRISMSGAEYWIPKSMAFHKMSPDEFEKVYSKTLDFICSHILSGTNRKDIDEQIMRFM